MKRAMSSVGLFAAALIVAGCATPAPDTNGQQAGNESVGSTPNHQGKQDQRSGGDELAFGETSSGTNVDLTVRALDPFEFTTSEFAAPEGGAPAWGVEFEFVNRGQESFSPAMYQVAASVDGEASNEVFDPEPQGADVEFGGLLAAPVIGPGQKATVPAAYSGSGEVHEINVSAVGVAESVTFTDDQ